MSQPPTHVLCKHTLTALTGTRWGGDEGSEGIAGPKWVHPATGPNSKPPSSPRVNELSSWTLSLNDSSLQQRNLQHGYAHAQLPTRPAGENAERSPGSDCPPARPGPQRLLLLLSWEHGGSRSSLQPRSAPARAADRTCCITPPTELTERCRSFPSTSEPPERRRKPLEN